jgi:hypothetical protein
MSHGIANWPHPLEAKIAVARRDWQARHFGRLYTGPMNIELLVTEAIREPGGPFDQLRA